MRIPNVPSQVVAPREIVTTMRAHVLPIHQSLPFGPGAVVGKDVPLHVALPRRPAVALRRDGAEHERADDGLDVDPEVLLEKRSVFARLSAVAGSGLGVLAVVPPVTARTQALEGLEGILVKMATVSRP